MEKKDVVIAIGFILLAQIAGIIGSVFTADSVSTWYITLNRPTFAPPNYLFAPVWIALYTLMGIASYLIWKKGWNNQGIRIAIYVYLTQLVLNSVWSILFFGFKNLGLAFGEILLLWLMIVVTTYKFYKIDKRSAYLMIPYILWVSFAAVLNYSYWLLNI